MLDSALVGPELASTFLSIIIRFRYARLKLQYLRQLLANPEAVEPATSDRFTIVCTELLANDLKSMSDLSSLLDIVHDLVLRQSIIF